MYVLPKEPGTYEALNIGSFNVDCLITGAEILPYSNVLILTGYSTTGGTYTWLFKNFSGNNFFNGDNTQFIWTLLTQIEGVCVDENNSVYISSENFSSYIEPTLYHFDFTEYITGVSEIKESKIRIYTSESRIIIESASNELLSGKISLVNQNGSTLYEFQIRDKSTFSFPVNLNHGIYVVVFETEKHGTRVKKFVF